MKVVINACYGGFGLSYKAVLKYGDYAGLNLCAYEYDYSTPITKLAGRTYTRVNNLDSAWPLYWTKKDLGERCTWEEMRNEIVEFRVLDRADPILVRVVEELGHEADGKHSSLKVVEIPDDVEYIIDEYDGWEHVAEVHRTWG